MSDKPIIFSAPMVRALLDGRKTMTRRIYKVPPGSYVEQGRVWAMTDGCQYGDAAIPYAPGDRLYVREAWCTSPAYDDIKPSEMGGDESIRYAADGIWESWGWGNLGCVEGRARTSIHMPRWASRITLIVTSVKVERLQEISEEDAKAEGAIPLPPLMGEGQGATCTFADVTTRNGFRDLWNSIHGPDAWDANPWVAAISFTVHKCNIDQMAGAPREKGTQP